MICYISYTENKKRCRKSRGSAIPFQFFLNAHFQLFEELSYQRTFGRIAGILQDGFHPLCAFQRGRADEGLGLAAHKAQEIPAQDLFRRALRQAQSAHRRAHQVHFARARQPALDPAGRPIDLRLAFLHLHAVQALIGLRIRFEVGAVHNPLLILQKEAPPARGILAEGIVHFRARRDVEADVGIGIQHPAGVGLVVRGEIQVREGGLQARMAL